MWDRQMGATWGLIMRTHLIGELQHICVSVKEGNSDFCGSCRRVNVKNFFHLVPSSRHITFDPMLCKLYDFILEMLSIVNGTSANYTDQHLVTAFIQKADNELRHWI